MIGPGKYDDVATVAREATKAEGLILIVISGDKGHGFSVQLAEHLVRTVSAPYLLRHLADEIEKDLKASRK